MTTKGSAQLARPFRLLAVVAHPIDADVAIGGSVACWVSEGTVAHLACITSGDAQATDASIDPLALGARREAEQRRAAATIGYQAVTFLHRPDGAVANDLALREQLVRLIRETRPDVVASLDPRVFIGGDGGVRDADQRAAAAAAVDAAYPAAGEAMAFPHLVHAEGLDPHRVARLYLFGSDDPDTWVDISSTLELKLQALRAHASQAHRLDALQAAVRSSASASGQAIGTDAAEGFAVVDLA
jgi:LmbE family N-acetylglucosaminyl deacetylase